VHRDEVVSGQTSALPREDDPPENKESWVKD